jgi:hypothetical protein
VPPLTHTYDLRIAGCRAKKAKTILASLAASPNNQELRCLTDAGVVPDWFLGIQEVWKHAMNHVSHLDLAAQELPRRFVLPPIHLFWGGEPQNQCIYYYHYLLLFNEIKNRPEHDLLALSHSHSLSATSMLLQPDYLHHMSKLTVSSLWVSWYVVTVA